METMPRVQAIIEEPAFAEVLAAIDAAEADRVFCRHGLPHLLDVARVAWILNLEREAGLEREVVYAAALLHDVGRAAQYTTGESHEMAGERLAAAILDALPVDLRFSAATRADILGAVREHRGAGTGEEDSSLAALIREADHRSRPCFACSARSACNWTDERKNLSIQR